jgi:hypothetical protein
MIYQFREGSRFPVKPQVAGEELERIADIHGGKVIPGDVRDESRPEGTVLHRYFEWDNWTAAELHREEQARRLIRSIVRIEHVPGEPEPRPLIAYVHVRTSEGEPCYMSTAVVFTDEQLRAQAVADALALFNGVRKRCHDFEELQGVFEAIDRAAQEEAARQEAAQRAQAKRPKRRRAAQPRA